MQLAVMIYRLTKVNGISEKQETALIRITLWRLSRLINVSLHRTSVAVATLAKPYSAMQSSTLREKQYLDGDSQPSV